MTAKAWDQATAAVAAARGETPPVSNGAGDPGPQPQIEGRALLNGGRTNPADPPVIDLDDAPTEAEPVGYGVRLEDFISLMVPRGWVFLPTREIWSQSAVKAQVPPVDVGGENPIPATVWLDHHRPAQQATWAPGKPMLIKNRLISEGGWIQRPGCVVLNLYRPPTIVRRPGDARPWLDHVYRVYPDDAEHIIKWLAQRVQHPAVKINHALVLGGAPGVGKDTVLEPVKRAIGPWNFTEVSPQQVLGRFNGFLKSVILRVSEARDLGPSDRFAFYAHMKTYIAAPPDVLRIDEKNLREYSILNCCGAIITTNHKTDGIHLEPNDRRHFVAWSDLTQADFTDAYWDGLYRWFDNGGNEIVASYLHSLDLTGFNPKAPPPKTEAFWAIVAASIAPENGEMADCLERLDWPAATTIDEIQRVALEDFANWLKDRRNARQIPHRLEECNYVLVRNPAADKGPRWRFRRGGRRNIYAKSQLTLGERLAAAARLAAGEP